MRFILGIIPVHLEIAGARLAPLDPADAFPKGTAQGIDYQLVLHQRVDGDVYPLGGDLHLPLERIGLPGLL